MIHAEVTLYPLKTQNASRVINNSIETLDQESVEYEVGSMATHVHGNEDSVWNSLKSLFDQAQTSGGEVSMVVTITNSAKH
ncbi:YkoF family thiamine/hydroxymethylpyrimidine-binding protein [Serpentinicella sp. ANB-PHB4]|uniref:YkoF family thiamine/hydroxymethylpyrimidine-binding protein n=1 Tax=Serpentinicella sp. ANB-PHB4 TaxID=3074076 RepID=UPI0028649419|nr:YkoF family thiamine/hydroxymethylpyrimidine-binding protein [Serpentinicella sp. ANB-PHB4]MDR5659410.1 YkoF family thiamine/hydroxymethylpyrimidine-binding protein [Serpentinicella sp. ANB-PHB4]